MASTLARFESSGFYLWEHLKHMCMQLLLTTKRHFTIALWVSAKTIRNCPGIFELIRLTVLRLVEACIESHRGHFEHL
jgi:hypothetical protein